MIYFYWLTGLFLAAAAAILASVVLDARDEKKSRENA